jgi:hypothetical protein
MIFPVNSDMMQNTNQALNEITTSSLRVFLFVTHLQQEQLQEIIQFLHRHKLIFHRIKNEKQRNAYNYLRKNANYIAESIEPITSEQFVIIGNFLCSKTLVIGFFYKNQIWNSSRVQNAFSKGNFNTVSNLLTRINF